MAHQSTGEGSRNSLGNRESPERSRDKLHCILRQWLARRVLRSGLEFEVSGARFGVGPCKTDELFRAAKATVARDIGEAIGPQRFRDSVKSTLQNTWNRDDRLVTGDSRPMTYGRWPTPNDQRRTCPTSEPWSGQRSHLAHRSDLRPLHDPLQTC
jgi:hypothetical protein